MAKNFWKNIQEPILALAPMAGFSNSVFRQICQEQGADVLYSEMASVAAIFYNQKENDKTLSILKRGAKEKNYVAQLFGAEPEHFALATRIVTEKIKPDGIDINCGCPVGKIIKQGAGADLMKNPPQALKIIKAVLDNTDLPVSIKIRVAAGKIKAEDFVSQFQGLKIAAIMVHGRTLAQGFSGPIDYSVVSRLRPIFKGKILINGGLTDLSSAKQALESSQADGLGLARGALGRPWLFSEIKKGQEEGKSLSEISQLMIRQAKMIEEQYGPNGILEFRKHLCWYVQGLPGASSWRRRLTQITKTSEIKDIFSD